MLLNNTPIKRRFSAALFIVVCRESNSPTTWIMYKWFIYFLYLIPSTFMVLMTVRLRASLILLTLWANCFFILFRMVLAFIPTVTHRAFQAKCASVLVDTYRFRYVPLAANLTRIGNQIRLTSKILPVVRIDTRFSLVLWIHKRTPHCFVMENIKICIKCKLADQINANFRLIVCKWTVLTIITKSSTW